MEKEHKSKLNSPNTSQEPDEKPKKAVSEMELVVPKVKKTKNKTTTPNEKHESHKKAEEKKIENPAKIEIAADTIIVNKTPTSKTSKSSKSRFAVPFYVFVTILLAFAFGVGALSAMVIPPIPFSAKNIFDKTETQQTNIATVVEEVPTVQETHDASETPVEKDLKTLPPEISARAYGIYHLEEGEYKEITSKNPQVSLPMASVTKVMTAIIAMEQYDLDKPVVVPSKCVGINGSSVGFRANDVLTLQDMLYGLLVRSGADAACAIANIDNEADFLAQMNSRAQELGMTSTRFTNPIGFDNSDAHISNINDLRLLVSHALEFSTFRKIVGTEEITLTSQSNAASYRIRNTNDLLFTIPGTVGIKTGYTDSAGECLAYLYQNKDQEIMIIVLGSVDRFGDTTKLLNWAKSELLPVATQ